MSIIIIIVVIIDNRVEIIQILIQNIFGNPLKMKKTLADPFAL